LLIELTFPELEFAQILVSLEVTGPFNSQCLEPEEWLSQGLRHEVLNWRNQPCYTNSLDAPARKNQFKQRTMGKPVSVIFANIVQDLARIIVAGERVGNGSEQDRAVMRWFISTVNNTEEKLQRERLRLSSNNKFVQAIYSGHSAHHAEPQLIVAEAHNRFMNSAPHILLYVRKLTTIRWSVSDAYGDHHPMSVPQLGATQPPPSLLPVMPSHISLVCFQAPSWAHQLSIPWRRADESK
jgi:hypothetical protein